MHRPEFFFRILQQLADGKDIGQIALIGFDPDPAEHGQLIEKKVDRLGIIHFSSGMGDQLLFLKSPLFQAWIKSAQASGFNIFMGGL